MTHARINQTSRSQRKLAAEQGVSCVMTSSNISFNAFAVSPRIAQRAKERAFWRSASLQARDLCCSEPRQLARCRSRSLARCDERRMMLLAMSQDELSASSFKLLGCSEPALRVLPDRDPLLCESPFRLENKGLPPIPSRVATAMVAYRLCEHRRSVAQGGCHREGGLQKLHAGVVVVADGCHREGGLQNHVACIDVRQRGCHREGGLQIGSLRTIIYSVGCHRDGGLQTKPSLLRREPSGCHRDGGLQRFSAQMARNSSGCHRDGGLQTPALFRTCERTGCHRDGGFQTLSGTR